MIVKHGAKNDIEEQLPLLLFDGCKTAHCIDAIEELSYNNITQQILSLSPLKLSSTNELKQFIKEQYSAIIPNLNIDEGVGVTILRII